MELLGSKSLTPLVLRALHRVIGHAPIKLGNMADSERERTADWFRRFAAGEGAESSRYRDWAEGVANDAHILDLIG